MLENPNAVFENKRYLIVDDFQGIRTMLREILKSFGVKQVDTASSGKEAITCLSRQKYDVVLCDYNLGAAKNGQQVLEEAKVKSLIGPSTAWIILTAEKTSEMVYGAAEFLPDDYLVKPISENGVKERLLRVLARKSDLLGIEKAIRSKDFSRAIALCDEVLKSSKTNHTELLRIKTGLLLDMGQYEQAAGVFEKILAVRDVSWAKTGLAKARFFDGQNHEALHLLQEVIEDNPAYLEAYDFLAQVHEQLGNFDDAQFVLQRSTELSPHSLTRQKRLGDIAQRRGEMTLAENAYRKTIKLGEHSVLKSADAYLRLAKICADKENQAEALKLLKDVGKEFDSREAKLQAKVLEVDVCRRMGDDSGEQSAMNAVSALAAQGDNRTLAPEVAVDAAAVMLANGNKEAALKLMQTVVNGNNEDEQLLARVMAVFRVAGIEEEGRELIEKSKREAADTNNRAVVLAKEGKLDEALDWLRDAKLMLPNSKQILLNFAFVSNLYMQKNGRSDSLLREARDCLDKVAKLDPRDKKRVQIREMLEAVAAKTVS